MKKPKTSDSVFCVIFIDGNHNRHLNTIYATQALADKHVKACKGNIGSYVVEQWKVNTEVLT